MIELLLLDITHWLITAGNVGLDPAESAESLPLERVREVHLSGLSHQSGRWWDDHAVPVPDEAFELLERLAPRLNAQAVTFEYNWAPSIPAHAVGLSDRPGPRSTVVTAARPSARSVHSAIATYVADPNRLAREAAKPPAERPTALRELDLDTLADFTGLTEKVRHNQVRGDLQMTFRLLRLTGQEIQLFRDYAPISLQRRQQRLTSPAQRLDGLVEFTENWAGTDSQRCLVRDLLRYEHTVAAFRRDACRLLRTTSLGLSRPKVSLRAAREPRRRRRHLAPHAGRECAAGTRT